MKKFQYELQSVLEFREFEQEQAEIELGKALAVEQEINNQLELIAIKLVNAKKQVEQSSDFNDIISFSNFSNLMDIKKDELLNQLTQAKIVTEEKRAILTECMKKTNALNKLKEQQLSEYKQTLLKKEKNFIDELGTQGFFRNNIE